MSKFSLVLPTYNEAPHIKAICRDIIGVLEARNTVFEIIIVDDNSADGTWRLARELSLSDARIRILRRKRRQGLASAVADGWSIANGDILGVMDADFQHPPHTLTAMLDMMSRRDDIDIVIAGRHFSALIMSGLNPLRAVISRLACLFAGILLPRAVTGINDPMSGFFIFRKKVIEASAIKPIGYKVLLEVLVKGSYRRREEILYTFNRRRKGKSKMGILQCAMSCFHMIKLAFLYPPCRNSCF
ncbi:MAG: glycosyltransferase [Candidatus Omnitrophica bacterium]|nr:glycosyltransferase [Candidatus Omnitrophota bacterium]